MNKKPIIYLAFGRNDTNSLLHLEEELRAIRKIITQQESFEFLIDQNASIREIVETLLNYKDRISIFHYAGHIGYGNEIILQDDSEGVNLEGLTKVISVLKNLRLVFLNGASSSRTVKELLESGVKAVIATNRPVTDSAATKFSIQFYKYFIQGKSLFNSFESAASQIKLEETPTTRYFHHEKEKELAWGLYANEGENQILDWKISDEELKLSLNRISPIIEKLEYIKSCIDFESNLNSQINTIEEKWRTLENTPRDTDDKSKKIFSLESKIIEIELDVIIKYELGLYKVFRFGYLAEFQ